MNATASYRTVLRELRRAAPNVQRGSSVTSSFRALFATTRSGETPETVSRETENLLVFLKAQREYGELLARYNPLHDLSADDHRKATAHRVGLDMPKEYQDEQ